LCVSDVTVQNSVASSASQLARDVANARIGSSAEPPFRSPTKYRPTTTSRMPTMARALGSSCRISAPPAIVSSGMNPMIGWTAETSPRLSAAERHSIPPISFGMTIASARQKVGVAFGQGPASSVATARRTPPTARNATVDTTTPASPTARLSRRLVPAEAAAASNARTIHMDGKGTGATDAKEPAPHRRSWD
jgi:hypothetical protein